MINVVPHPLAQTLAKSYTNEKFLKFFKTKIVGQKTSYCEIFTNDKEVKPYFDRDCLLAEEPSQDWVAAHLDLCKQNILTCFSEFGVSEGHINWQGRHRWVNTPKGRLYKVGFHFIVNGFKIPYKNIACQLKKCKQEAFWDMSVYNTNSLFYMVDTVKKGDSVELKAMSEPDKPWLHIVQYLHGSEHLITLAPDVVERHAPSTFEHADLGVESNEMVGKLTNLLRDCGDKTSKWDGKVIKNNSYYFRNLRGRKCLLTGEFHKENNFYLIPQPDGTTLYKCLAHTHEGGVNNSAVYLGRWKPAECLIEDDETDTPPRLIDDDEDDEPQTAPPTPPPAEDKKGVFKDMFLHTSFRVGIITSLRQAYNKEKHKKKKEILKFAMLKYFDRFFLTLNSTKIEVIELVYDDQNRLVDYIRRSKQETDKLCANALWTGGDGKMTGAFGMWWVWDLKNTYDRLVYKPNGVIGPREFNLFLGFKVDLEYDWKNYEVDKTKIEKMLFHIEQVICNGDEVVFVYFMKWLKVMLIEKRKTGICPVMIGGQGLGKGAFLENFLGDLLIGGDVDGKRSKGSYCMLGNMNDLLGQFNQLSVNRFFINLNEAGSGSGYKQAGLLKTLITDKTMRWEQKGLDTLVIQNLLNLIISGNEEKPIKTDMDDRRYLIMIINEMFKQNKDYFRALFAEMETEDMPAYFMKYLDTMVDSSDFFLTNVPMTEGKMEMVQHSIPSPAKFVSALCQGLDTCSYETEVEPNKRGMLRVDWLEGGCVHTEVFYKCYEEWYKGQGYGQYDCKKHSRDDFTKFFTSLGIDITQRRKHGVKKQAFIFGTDRGHIWELLKTKKYVTGFLNLNGEKDNLEGGGGTGVGHPDMDRM